MAASRVLEKAGFIYLEPKKGNYDIELWGRRGNAPSEETVFPSCVAVECGVAGGATLTSFTVSRNTPELIKTNQSCQYCGMSISEAGFVFGNPDEQKTVILHVCINPKCNFHYVNVNRV